MLEGPNLYFSRAAIKLTLDVTALTEVSVEVADRLAKRVGLSNARTGDPGTGFRQRFAARALSRLVRQIAAEAGTHRLAVRVRPTGDPDRLVVAYPWRHRTRGEALGRGVGDVLDGLGDADVDDVVGRSPATCATLSWARGRRRSDPRSRWWRSREPTARPPRRG